MAWSVFDPAAFAFDSTRHNHSQLSHPQRSNRLLSPGTGQGFASIDLPDLLMNPNRQLSTTPGHRGGRGSASSGQRIAYTNSNSLGGSDGRHSYSRPILAPSNVQRENIDGNVTGNNSFPNPNWPAPRQAQQLNAVPNGSIGQDAMLRPDGDGRQVYKPKMSSPNSASASNGSSGHSSHVPSRNEPNGSSTLNRVIPRIGNQNWAYPQELKTKILGIPRGFWTKDVYEKLSGYGTIVRIEMHKGAMDCCAWVTFQ